MCVLRSLIIIPIMYIPSEYSHDGLFYRHNSTYGKLCVREIAVFMLTNLLLNSYADLFHLYHKWRILLRDNSREKKQSPNYRWGKNPAEKDLRGRELRRRLWEKNGLALRQEMAGAEDVESNAEPQQVWTQAVKKHMAGELTECCSKNTQLKGLLIN